METESEKMEQLLELVRPCLSDEGWTVVMKDNRVKMAHRPCPGPGRRQLMKLEMLRVAIKNPPQNPNQLLVRPEVRAQFQTRVSPIAGNSFDLVECKAPGDGVFWRWHQLGLLRLCCLFFGSLTGNTFFCTDTPTLAHHKLRRDFPERGDCVYAGRLENSECGSLSEGMFITRPTESPSHFSVTIAFVFSESRWKWAAWASPHIWRLAHLAEKCIQWVLNRPGVAELRVLDEQHYIVLAVSCTKRGPPMLPASSDLESVDIQAGEALGFAKWRRFEGSPDEKFSLARYLQNFMASMGEDIAIYCEMDGRQLVYYQCAVRRSHWSRVCDRFREVFQLQKAAYRRANGGSNAPSLTEDVAPRFVSRSRETREPSPGLPVQKIVVRRTFVENASDDESDFQALHRAATDVEPDLLKEALQDLHRDLLEGLREWSERLQDCSEIEVFPPREREYRGILAHADTGSAKQLVEIGLYLLVWGEAGNIRFMPELIYFLTELALASEDVLTGGSAYHTGSGTVKSGLFLAKVTRPIYNVVFEEWYVKVDVDPKNQRDKKVLRDELHRFLPADTANYDDWNELFCDPARMAKRLVLDDGSRLFDVPHERRFSQLHRVDWRRVLAASGVKTHREVHSLWGVFASIHRVVLLHAVLFLFLLLMASENEVPAMSTSGTVLGKTRATRFAVLGLLVPLHGFALYYSRWEVTGTALRIRNCGRREIARLLKHAFFAFLWAIPAITYIIIRAEESNQDQSEDLQSEGLSAVLTVHYVVSAIGIGVGLFLPIWSTDAIWSLTRVSVLVQFSRYLFWGCVLTVKCVLAYYGLISKMLRSVEKLRLSQYSQADVYAMGWRGLFLNAPLSRDFLEGCGIWGAAFFLFFADTLLWHILGCTILGVCYVFVQRRGRVRSFVTEALQSRGVSGLVLPGSLLVPNRTARHPPGIGLMQAICYSDASSDEESAYDCGSTGGHDLSNTEEKEGLMGGDADSHHEGQCGKAVSRMIWNSRYCLVICWPLLALIMAPFAYKLVLNALPLPKTAPHGTASFEAEELFEVKFPYLVGMKMEMIVLKCTPHCGTAVSVESQAYVEQLRDMVLNFGNDYPGTIIDVRSYYTFGDKIDSNPMLAHDQQSILFVWSWRVNGTMKLIAQDFAKRISTKIEYMNAEQIRDVPGQVAYDIAVTGPTFLNIAMKETVLHEVPIHEIETLWLPFAILALRLQSARLLLLALCSMPISILISFGFMYFVSLHLPVIMYALVMMLMLCTALSFDYSLFTMTRYAEERKHGATMEEAIDKVITQSGHVVMVSGLVLTIAYAAMLVLPGAFKSFCVAACAMILCCIGVQMTFVPCVLALVPWLGAGFEPTEEDRQAELLEEMDAMEKGDFDDEDFEFASPAKRRAYARVQPFRSGAYYEIGGLLTKCPLNILVPFLIYAVMTPLTLRVMKYKMGHAYELQVPRGRPEWATSIQIQRDFPPSVGCMMPTLIIATNRLQDESKDRHALVAPEDLEAMGGTANDSELILPVEITTEAPLDVRGQAFFDENCRMVNSLIQASQNHSFALDSDDFQSPTFYGAHENGDVKCLNYQLTHYYRANYFTQKFMFTSRLMQKLWDQLVSSERDAMLTLLTPKMDPFSAEAFNMTKEIRHMLHNASETARNYGFPGITYRMFSPSAIMMDMIEVTHDRLFVAFMGCAMVCFILIAISFHAWLIPFKLLFTVILPITWAYGAALYVYEDGFLEFTGIPGLSPTYITNSGPAGLDWTVPMFTLTIMLGLALEACLQRALSHQELRLCHFYCYFFEAGILCNILRRIFHRILRRILW
ncbi:FKS1 [Symbiodinium natans]|uniref:FKS1 protein n=1 Tax=Symbiodinium natans TaxID=878477 RepID=A0A812V0U6_9DINO|nr:FKS1 [Symbiodinium natans]